MTRKEALRLPSRVGEFVRDDFTFFSLNNRTISDFPSMLTKLLDGPMKPFLKADKRTFAPVRHRVLKLPVSSLL